MVTDTIPPFRLDRDIITGKLVVLDAGDAGIVEDGKLVTDGYTRLLGDNLENLYQALLAANQH